ncbi:MAG: hypothetical protein K2G63_00205 [Oscillospiraceae bacterium]|nr:hypothetical protein [Oscillospiraceae bacterium]
MRHTENAEKIAYAKTDLKIPDSAERIFLTEDVFIKFRQNTFNPEMYEFYHCCGYEEYGEDYYWKHTCWIELFEVDEDFTENNMWHSIHYVFERFSEEAKNNDIAYKYYDIINDSYIICIIGRHLGGMDYKIHAQRKKVNLKKNFPNSFYINKFERNHIPLIKVLKYKKTG